jgi:hypothetical protein
MVHFPFLCREPNLWVDGCCICLWYKHIYRNVDYLYLLYLNYWVLTLRCRGLLPGALRIAVLSYVQSAPTSMAAYRAGPNGTCSVSQDPSHGRRSPFNFWHNSIPGFDCTHFGLAVAAVRLGTRCAGKREFLVPSAPPILARVWIECPYCRCAGCAS